VLFRDSALRRNALQSPIGDASRYSLYGLDELRAAGCSVHHDLEPRFEPGTRARTEGALLDRAITLAGGYSGDFPRVLSSLAALNKADVVFSTVDTVGIPLALLGRLGRVDPPVVYASIGLPERISLIRRARTKRWFADAFRRLHTVVAYGWSEVEELRDWLPGDGPGIEFVAFGVDADHFRPDPADEVRWDVVAIGADPRRDLALLLDVARRLPRYSFHVVGTPDGVRELGVPPANVTTEVDVPFGRVRQLLRAARVVALPVRENSYSGATTTLLQAMACGKPVVVSRTSAIARGYHLDDGVNCKLVAPGDRDAFAQALEDALSDGGVSEAVGRRARETVERHLTWARYTDEIRDLLFAAAATKGAVTA
jgi:glycosyltransferase involved in cell wall biosynthesis